MLPTVLAQGIPIFDKDLELELDKLANNFAFFKAAEWFENIDSDTELFGETTRLWNIFYLQSCTASS